MPPSTRIDAPLREAAERREVPGVVAMAATERGILYEGAFGLRALPGGPPMTPDTVFRIASMTKAVTSVAAMQLVEQGKLSLDDPVPAIDPALASPQVLDGFDAAGNPILRQARRPITLRHLLTHTSGLAYEIWDAEIVRYIAATGLPSVLSGRLAALRLPLVFDPGARWEYGINIEWVGRIVEEVGGLDLAAYFRDHIFAPLGLTDIGFGLSPVQQARQAVLHQRRADGSLEPQQMPATVPEFYSGGGGLTSTAGDYMTFLRMLLNGGTLGGARILKQETVALMGRNQIGDLPAGVMQTAQPGLSHDVDLFPGQKVRWGLGYMLTPERGPNGRSAGSVTWGGLFNTYYWLDPAKRVAGLIMTQILPWLDPQVMALYGAFERAVYAMLDAA